MRKNCAESGRFSTTTMYEKNNSWAMRKLFWGAGASCLEHFSSTGTTSKTTHSCSTFITYYWAIKSFPWRIQWKFCLTRFFCRWVPAPSRDLCCLTMTAFYPVYCSPSVSCPCVIACLMLEVGQPSYWMHLGYCFQCSFASAIHIINIPVISCSYSAEMTLITVCSIR